MDSLFFRRYRIVILILAIISSIFVMRGALHALATNSNRPEDWLPENFQETKDLYWFADHFVGDDMLMISWDGCDIEDPRVSELTAKLREPVDISGEKSVVLFRSVLSGDELIEQLMAEPLSLDRQQAMARLSGWLIGAAKKDGTARVDSVVLCLSPDGWRLRHAMLAHVYYCLNQLQGLQPEQIHLAGTTMDGLSIDEASEYMMPQYTAASFAICFFLMWVSFRSFWLSVMVFANAMFCQQLSLALIVWCGSTMDSVLLMVPSLIFVLSVSTGVHLVNNYRDVVVQQGLAGAHIQAIRHAMVPCWLSSLTTALGLISLVASFLVPVQKFAVFATAGVMLGTAIIFLLFPSQIEQWPPRRWADRVARESGRHSNPMEGMVTWIVRRRLSILVITCALMAWGFLGVQKLQSTARIHDLFAPGAKILRDYEWLEKNIGPLTPIEIIVRIPKASLAKSQSKSPLLDRIQLVGRVQQAVSQVENVDAVVSAVNFAPVLSDATGKKTGLRQIALRTALEKRLGGQLETFRLIQFYSDTSNEELWRVSARIPTGADIDLQVVIAHLRESTRRVFDEDPAKFAATATICGGVPLVQKSQDQLLIDMTQSFLTAFGLITITMMVTLRSFFGGLLAMVSNVLPAVVVFGLLGWWGIKIEIGSMMTTTAAMGIAVDDTLHFITWFRRGSALGMAKQEALAYTYRHCSLAMLQSSMICGFGLLVYSLSPFFPIARFSWLMFGMLAIALVGDLVVLPAIISSPLGYFFIPKPNTSPLP